MAVSMCPCYSAPLASATPPAKGPAFLYQQDFYAPNSTDSHIFKERCRRQVLRRQVANWQQGGRVEKGQEEAERTKSKGNRDGKWESKDQR